MMAAPSYLAATAATAVPGSSSSSDAAGELDKLSPAQVRLLVTEAAQGKLKSAKALRDALNLPVTVQRVQQMLSSADFQERVRQLQRVVGGKRDAGVDNDNDVDSDYNDDSDGLDDDDDDDEFMDTAVAATGRAGKAKAANPLSASSGGSDALMAEPLTAAGDAGGPVTVRVTAPNGAVLTLSVNEKFKDRAAIKQAVRAFAEAQGKSVVIQRKTNGGNNFVYVCKSKTPCAFYVKVRRTQRYTSTTHLICALQAQHGPECSGKPPKSRLSLKMQQQQQLSVDLLPARSASVTLHDGSELTLYERQEFTTRAELKDFVHDFALAQEKRARVDRLSSGGNNITFVCTSQTQCTFKVRALRSKKTHLHYIKAFEADHGAECTGKPSVTKRQVLKRLTQMDAVPTLALSGADVQAMVKSLQGVDVTPRVASDARCELVNRVLKDAMAGIQKLESLLAQFQALNPTSAAQVDFDNDGTFKRAFLKLPYTAQVQSRSARVLGLTASDMGPSSNFRGMLLELVVKDGNNDAYTVAVALCDAKGSESYVWFLNCCVLGGVSFDAPMFCNRNSAILNAVASLPIPFTLIQCTQSLIAGIEEKLQPLTDRECAEILRAQDADTEAEYKAVLAALGASNAQLAEYLRSTDANTWTKHCYVKRIPLYGCHSASLVSPQSEHASLHAVSTRELGQFEFFQSYMERCMKLVYQGKRNAKSWANAGRALTAFAENALKQQHSDALACHVVPSDDESGIAYVYDTRSAQPKKCRVNLSASSCTCSLLEQLALPCKHLVAAVTFFNDDCGAAWDLSQLCDTMYTAQAYFEVYGQLSPIEIPVEEELVRNANVKIAPSVTTNRCSRCHEIGHNKRRCPNSGADGSADVTANASSSGDSPGDNQQPFDMVV